MVGQCPPRQARSFRLRFGAAWGATEATILAELGHFTGGRGGDAGGLLDNSGGGVGGGAANFVPLAAALPWSPMLAGATIMGGCAGSPFRFFKQQWYGRDRGDGGGGARR